MSDKFYITTSIAYVNAKPHIGFAMELIQADVLARYHRLVGDDTFYLTGTDEHGLKIQQTAETEEVTTQELVDRNSGYFQELTKALTISNNHFIRTTNQQHKKAVQDLWLKMVLQGDIYKDGYEGLYCVGCEAFVLEKDLIDGKCPNHNREPEVLKEENWFFRLSKYNDKIREAIEKGDLKIVPESRQNEILSVLKEGLKDVSFSRPTKVLQWGIPVPNDPDQVMYVWCDALSNYITGIGYGSDEAKFEHFWPANVQLIGKDILRFHAAIWIGMLMSSELPIPKAIYVHGFITSEGKKMSKSLQNVVDPFEYVEAYGADALRYYLLKEIPTTDDGDFSKHRFSTVYGSELANTIGNLVSRVVAMTHKYCGGKVPANHHHNKEVAAKVEALWEKYHSAIEQFDLKQALELVQDFAFFANKYVEDHRPWVLAKESIDNLHQVLYDLLEMLRQIGLLLLPFLPATGTQILSYLGQTGIDSWEGQTSWGGLAEETQLLLAAPLFMRKEEK